MSTITPSPSSASSSSSSSKLTQKEYFIAIRNRLFAVEEQIWLHEYAVAHPSSTKVRPLSQAKYDEFVIARGELLEEYPLTKLYLDLRDAQQNNLTYAAIYLERLINTFHRQLPLSMEHVNQIAVLSFSGQVMNLMRGQGLVHQRILPSSVIVDKGIKRQFQHPVFSRTGRYVSFAELHFKETSIARSDVLVYNVPKDPNTYGSTDIVPIFDSGMLPGAPFFLLFSPDEETIVMLSTSPSNSTSPADSSTALLALEWGKMYRKDSWAGQAAVSRFTPRKALTLLRGNPLFFSFTTSNPNNATIVAHCQKEISDPNSKSIVQEKAVWLLERQDTAGVNDFSWKKISVSDPKVRWPTPVCHSAGGGDNVLVVEDGFLVSKALSRWKRDNSGELVSKKLLKVSGQVQFLVSPDHSKAVILQEDINVGHYSLTVIDGEASLDPMSSSPVKSYEVPHNKLTVAFWFSPDSTKLLCLTASGKTKEDVMTQKSQFRVGLNSDMEWIVFNFPLQEWKEYDTFKPTPYFMKTYVPFFSQYAQVDYIRVCID